MKHVVQVEIDLDDDEIREFVKQNILDQVTAVVRQDVVKAFIGETSMFAADYTKKIQEIISKPILDYFNAHREEVIADSIEKFVERLHKSKMVKAMLSERFGDEI